MGKTFIATKRCCLISTCVALCLVFGGCKSDQNSSTITDFRLNISTPEVLEQEVTVNGGVAVPIERIQWDWGDGSIDPHHFFPASHTYAKPGRYEIKVTAYDSKNQSASKSVTVEIK